MESTEFVMPPLVKAKIDTDRLDENSYFALCTFHEIQGFEETDQFTNFDVDVVAFKHAHAWYKSFPLSTSINMPSFCDLCSNPTQAPHTFMERLTAWAHGFESTLINDGYNPRDPLEKPDKRKKRVHSASVVTNSEAPRDKRFKERNPEAEAAVETAREWLNRCKRNYTATEQHYAAQTREIQRQMIAMCAMRDLALGELRQELEDAKETYRKAKSAI
jgi:hypothetical protein